METLTNAANAASRAIFGDATADSGNEPVSGKMGDTSKGEPYDAGNLDSTDTELTNPETNTTKDTSTQKTSTDTSTTNNKDTSTETTKTTDLPVREKEIPVAEFMSQNLTAKSGAPGNTSSTNPIQSEQEQDKTGVMSTSTPSTGLTSDKPSSSNENPTTGPSPSVSAAPTSGVQDTQKQQGADRPEDEPSSDAHQRIQEAKKEAEEAQTVDVSGPGPVPLEELAKKGGAGKTGAATTGGEDDGPQKESQGEGTGEKYVKSSGLKSEGGDFDAANPGAGKEADRLLEQKGVHHSTPGEAAAAEEDNGSPEPSEGSGDKKPSLKEKIKAKLHRH